MRAFSAIGIGLGLIAASCGSGASDSSTKASSSDSKTSGPAAAQATSTAATLPQYAYVFGKEKVLVVDPKTAKVVKEITAGLEGAGAWNDAVNSADGQYVFINENAKAQVYVFDTAKMELVKRVDVGAKPVHIYLPNHGNEVWTHADGDGSFYIIDTKSLEVVGKTVASTSLPPTGHGKLAYDPSLGTKYYATNTTEPSIFTIDGKTRTSARVEVCKGSDGKGGTHGKSISTVSKQAYFQCSGGEMAGKTVVVNTETNGVVKYLDTNGQIFPTDDGKYMTVANSANNRLDVIDASKGDSITSVPVPNKPDKVYYTKVDGKTLAVFADLKTPDVDVVDMSTLSLVKSIAGTPLETPLAADKTIGRNSDVGGQYFATVVKDQEQLNIVDLRSSSVVGSVKLTGALNVIMTGTKV